MFLSSRETCASSYWTSMRKSASLTPLYAPTTSFISLYWYVLPQVLTDAWMPCFPWAGQDPARRWQPCFPSASCFWRSSLARERSCPMSLTRTTRLWSLGWVVLPWILSCQRTVLCLSYFFWSSVELWSNTVQIASMFTEFFYISPPWLPSSESKVPYSPCQPAHQLTLLPLAIELDVLMRLWLFVNGRPEAAVAVKAHVSDA